MTRTLTLALVPTQVAARSELYHHSEQMRSTCRHAIRTLERQVRALYASSLVRLRGAEPDQVPDLPSELRDALPPGTPSPHDLPPHLPACMHPSAPVYLPACMHLSAPVRALPPRGGIVRAS